MLARLRQDMGVLFRLRRHCYTRDLKTACQPPYTVIASCSHDTMKYDVRHSGNLATTSAIDRLYEGRRTDDKGPNTLRDTLQVSAWEEEDNARTCDSSGRKPVKKNRKKLLYSEHTIKKTHEERMKKEWLDSAARRRTRMGMHRARGQLQALLLNDALMTAISLAMGFVNLRYKSSQEAKQIPPHHRSQFAADPQVFSSVLVMVGRYLRTAEPLDGSEKILHQRERDPSLIIRAVTNLCHRLAYSDSVDANTTAAVILVLDAAHKYKARIGDKWSNALDSRLANLGRAVEVLSSRRKYRPLDRRTFRTTEENSIVGRLGLTVTPSFDDSATVSAHLKYQSLENPLLKELATNASPDQYFGSPYTPLQLTQERLMADFKEQIEVEMADAVLVETVWKKKKEEREGRGMKSLEQLIDQWDWRQNIQRQWAVQVNSIRDPTLRDFLRVLPLETAVDVAMRTAILILTEAKTVNVFYPLSYARMFAGDRILHYIRRRWLEKIGFYDDQTLTNMFAEFGRFFTDGDLPRQYTQREWWMLCAQRMNVDPYLECALSNDFDPQLRDRFGQLIIDTVMEAVRYPYKGKSRPAFFQTTVERQSSQTETFKYGVMNVIGVDRPLSILSLDRGFDHLSFYVSQTPLIVPPRPWLDDCSSGGLYTLPSSAVRSMPEYKFVNIYQEVEKRLECREQLRPVADALNELGSVAWRVNEKVLEVALEVFNMGDQMDNKDLLERLSLPLWPGAMPVADKPLYVSRDSFAQLSDEEKLEKMKEQSRWRTQMKERKEFSSLWWSNLYRLSMANHYRGRILYFPHNMDFRGRVYPIPPYLNHMGDDLARGIMHFAAGRALGEEGLYWLKLQCMNLTGTMKRQSLAERVQRVDQLLDQIIDSAEKPLTGERWWLSSEEPWQTLATCLEVREALQSDRPEDYVSHLPVHQDGSCNGLQHYAALGRDYVGGLEVNLVPAPRPQDVYTSVAERVEETRCLDEKEGNSELVQSLREKMPGPVARKTIKQTVMTTVYGVTEYGARDQIKRQLMALGIRPSKDVNRFASYLAKITLSSLDDSFKSSMKLKKWLSRNAKAFAGWHCQRGLEFVTPLGFPVVQPYMEGWEKEGDRLMRPMLRKQQTAFPPNYVHALDSTHMMLTTLHCRRLGIQYASVHDCFWTHAATVPPMNAICRRQFVNLHSLPLVEDLADQFRRTYLTAELEQCLGPEHFADLQEVVRNDMTLGELDLEQVMDSVYFFS